MFHLVLHSGDWFSSDNTQTHDFLIPVLNDGLNKNFSNVEVNVVDCPDLRQPPFHLAAEGKCVH